MSRIQVNVGGVRIGGGAPISIQSMTNTDTRNAEATVKQILELENAGCEIVRSSVYDDRCVEVLPQIISKIHIPLVADIHFDYRLAIGAIKAGVAKVRINPGNIGSEAGVRKLAECASAYGVPIRIGVNGGSLEKNFCKNTEYARKQWLKVRSVTRNCLKTAASAILLFRLKRRIR